MLYAFLISPMRATCPAHLYLTFLTILMKSTNYEALQYMFYLAALNMLNLK
jgi:hypothetical protein